MTESQDAALAVRNGIDCYGAGDLQGAAEALRRALALRPDHQQAQLYLGWVRRCLRLRGDADPHAAAPPPPAPPAAATPPRSGMSEMDLDLGDLGGDGHDLADLVNSASSAVTGDDREARSAAVIDHGEPGPSIGDSVVSARVVAPRLAQSPESLPLLDMEEPQGPAPSAAASSPSMDRAPLRSAPSMDRAPLRSAPSEVSGLSLLVADAAMSPGEKAIKQTVGHPLHVHALPPALEHQLSPLHDLADMRELEGSELSMIFSKVPLVPLGDDDDVVSSAPPPSGDLSQIFSKMPLAPMTAKAAAPAPAKAPAPAPAKALTPAPAPAKALTPPPAGKPAASPAPALPRASSGKEDLSLILSKMPLVQGDGAPELSMIFSKSPLVNAGAKAAPAPAPAPALGSRPGSGTPPLPPIPSRPQSGAVPRPPSLAHLQPLGGPGGNEDLSRIFSKNPLVSPAGAKPAANNDLSQIFSKAPMVSMTSAEAPRPVPPAPTSRELSALLSGIPINAGNSGNGAPADELELELPLDGADEPARVDMLSPLSPGGSLVSALSQRSGGGPSMLSSLNSDRGEPTSPENRRGRTSSGATSAIDEIDVEFLDSGPELEDEQYELGDPPEGTTLLGGGVPELDNILGQAQDALDGGDGDNAFELAEEGFAMFEHGLPLEDESGYHEALSQIYETLLMPLYRVPRAGRFPRDLEPHMAFLLSLLDGSMTLEEVLTVSGMDRLRGARAMVQLLRRGLIKLT